jgi:hypothetical protein
MVRQIVVATIASAAFGIALHAECVTLTAKEMMSRPGVLIFGGRVVDVQDVGQGGARWTIEVQRVWKGSVPARIDIYSSRFGPSEVRPPFWRKGSDALVLAARLSDVNVKEWKQTNRLSESDPSPEYVAYGCLDALENNFEHNLGPSHPPKK